MRVSAVLLLFALSACAAAPDPVPAGPVRVEVLGSVPHDTSAFTEGLELVDGVLYESTGLEGQSSIRRVDPATGVVTKKADLASPLFGEGLTVVGDRLWQLTWRDGMAIEWDRATLTEVRRVTYEGEGWGLCSDGDRLVMSDGSAKLTFRDPTTFAVTGSVDVTRDGKPVTQLNELECVGGQVWANEWQTERIARIDPKTGLVTATVDLSSVRPEGVPVSDVLNGIAAVPGTDEFLVTGKNWPSVFRVRFTSG